MKKLLYVAAIVLFLNITGCYTVIWSPGMDFPTADGTSEYNSTDTTDYYTGSDNYGDPYGDLYYSEPYYGHYANYYNTPWWYSITPPPGTISHNKNKGKATADRNGDITPVRNSGDGRGSTDRNSGTGDIINTPPVTVSGSSGNTTTGAGTTGSSDPKKTDSGTDNSRQGSNSGSVRNNDGNRNDGGRK